MRVSQLDRRQSGVSLIGDVPWGTHFCQLYHTKEELFDILAPYFAAGLDNNEFCVLKTSNRLSAKAAKTALEKSIPEFRGYLNNKQMEIIVYDPKSAGKRSESYFVSKLDRAVLNGFDGLRLAYDAFPEDGRSSFRYPEADNLAGYNALAVSAYPRDKFDAAGLMDVVNKHSFALVKNAGKWEVLKGSQARISKDALKRNEEKLQWIFHNMSEGFAYHRIVLDGKGKPCDYIFLEVNEAFEKLTGLKAAGVIDKRVTEVLPGIERDPADWIGKYGKVALSGKPLRFESYAVPLKRWYAVSAFSPQKGYFAATFSDITSRKESMEQLAAAEEIAHLGSWELDLLNNRLYWSDETYRIFGFKPHEFKATYEAFLEGVHSDDRKAVDEAYTRSLREGKDTYEIEHRVVKKSTGEIRYVHEKCEHIRDGSGKVVRSLGMVQDITERKKAKEELEQARNELAIKVEERTEELTQANRRMVNEILEREEIEKQIRARSAISGIIGKATTRKEYLDILVKHIKDLTGCRYVGLRVLNEEGEIPYESYAGFSRDFWDRENWLSLKHDRCACIRVVTGKALPQDKPCMSQGGSFLTNSALDFLNSLNEKEKKLFRGACMQEGFHSIAVVPIHYKNKTIAALHIADEHKDMVEPRKIELIELLAPLIGEGIHKFDIEEKIRQNHISQIIVNSLISFSFREANYEKILNRCLELLFSLNWLKVESKGSIFLFDDKTGMLVPAAQKNFPEILQKECARLPLGKCLCGKAASTRQIQFVDSLDERHEITNDGMSGHGHYCVPILSGEKLLGVINLYLPEKSRRDRRKEEFLSTIANALAGIIQRRQVEDELKKSSQRISNILESLTDGFFALDRHWRFTYVNSAAERILGVRREDLLGKVEWEVFPKAKDTKIYEEYHRCLMNKTPAFFEVLSPHTDKWMEIHVYPSEEGLSVYFRDISERKLGEAKLKEAQAQLERSRRLSDIGTLAATVAHELRNPLAAIRMASYNIKRKAQNPLLEKHFINIDKKISESDQIINNLLFYSRLKQAHFESVNLYKIMEECLGVAGKNAVKKDVVVRKKYRPLLRMAVEADPLQMKELFANILNNGYDALQGKPGTIEVEAKIEERNIKVVIKDSGIGMSEEQLKRAHEPFFTTKAKGTGLGLTVCFQIVNLHEGKLELSSEPGKGTAVSVTLPIRRNSGFSVPLAQAQSPSYERG